MWEKSTKIELCEKFDEWSKYYVWVIPPMAKLEKLKYVKQLILMNAEFFFKLTHFYLGNIIYLTKTLRDFLSNKNRILHQCKKTIIQ